LDGFKNLKDIPIQARSLCIFLDILVYK